jgi:hypothetical protein
MGIVGSDCEDEAATDAELDAAAAELMGVRLEGAKLLEAALDAIKVAGVAPATEDPVELKGPEGWIALAELAATGAAAAGAALETAAAGAGAGATDEAPAAGGP